MKHGWTRRTFIQSGLLTAAGAAWHGALPLRPAVAEGSNAGRAGKFEFTLEQEDAVFDLAPDQTRMVSCFQDAERLYHLFTDHIPTRFQTGSSRAAEISYWRSPDLRSWELVEKAIAHGNTTSMMGTERPGSVTIPTCSIATPAAAPTFGSFTASTANLSKLGEHDP